MKRFFELVIAIGLVVGLSSCGHSIADKQDFIRHAGALPDVVCVEENCSADQMALIEEAKVDNRKNFNDHPGLIVVYREVYITTGYNQIGPVVCLIGGPEYVDPDGKPLTELDRGLRALHLPENHRSSYPDYAQKKDATYLVIAQKDSLWDNNCAPNEEVREEARALNAELEVQGITVE